MLEVICANCGARAAAKVERCSACGSVGTLLTCGVAARPRKGESMVRAAADVEKVPLVRLTGAGVPWWDEAMPGGLVVGTTVTIYGPPGAEKTTYMGAIAARLALKRRRRAWMFSAEQETIPALCLVARIEDDLRALDIAGLERGTEKFERCALEVEREKPLIVVYDSVQAFECRGGWPGSDRAVRGVVQTAKRLAAKAPHVAILIAQVNAEGRAAGPHRALHDVDVVIELRPDRIIVRKNRTATGPRREVLR